MCNHDLKTLMIVANTNHDKNALELLIKKFMPLIKKYAFHLNYDEAESDLIICFLEFIYNLKPYKLLPYSEGELVNYIVQALKNKKIDLHRKRALGIKEVSLECLPSEPFQSDFESTVAFYQMLGELSERQRVVMTAKYSYGYTDSEIAKMMKISRQAVNRLKRRALDVLYKNWTEE